MKNMILKIAGAKNDKEFYDMFPSEEAFMAQHGATFRRAQLGATLTKAQYGTNVLEGVDTSMGTTYPQLKNYSFGQQEVPQYDPFNIDLSKNMGSGQDPFSNNKFNAKKGKFEYTDPYNKMISDNLKVPKLELGNPQGDQANTKMAKGIFQGALGGGSNSPLKNSIPIVGDIMGSVEDIGNAVSAFKEQNNQKHKLQQDNATAGLALEAMNTIDVDDRRQMQDIANKRRDFMMPESTGEEFFPIHGVGTNAIAQFGGALGGVGDMASNIGRAGFNNNAGFQMGKAVGELTKFIPVVGQIPGLSNVIGAGVGAIGGALDQAFGDAGKVKKLGHSLEDKNTQKSGNIFGQNNYNQFKSFRQDGGDVYEDYPMYEDGGEIQVLDGGVAENVAYNPALPEGGNLTTYTGQAHDGTPDGGIKILANGQQVEVEGKENSATIGDSIKIFGDLMVTKKMAKISQNPEVLALVDKYGQKKAKFMHNAIIDKTKSLNNKEAKLNKELEDYNPETPFDMLEGNSYKATKLGIDMKYDKLAKEASVLADYQTELKDTAQRFKLKASEFAKGNIIKDDGKFVPSVRTARDGDDLPMYEENEIEFAQPGASIKTGNKPEKITKEEYNKRISLGWTKIPGTNRITNKNIAKPGETVITSTADARKDIPKQSKNAYGAYGNVDKKLFEETKANNKWYTWDRFDPSNPEHVLDFQEKFNAKAKEIGSAAYIKPDSYFGDQTQTAKLLVNEAQAPGAVTEQYAEMDPETGAPLPTVPEDKSNPFIDAFNATLPFWRPTNKSTFDQNQLLGEMFALSHNQVEPVWAQSYKPQLRVPYDISLQDQLNAITSQTRAGQRLAGYNPAAQSIMAGVAYDPSTKVLGEQFRLNQQMKDQVYSGNLATLNDAQMKNIATFDQQANRQSMAVSNTKEATQAALNSASSKIQQHDLENHRLGIMENMYNYRYLNDRAINMNPLARFAWSGTGGKGAGGDGNYAEKALYHGEMARQNRAAALEKAGIVSPKDRDDDPTSIGQNGANVFKPMKKIPLTRQFKLAR